jgi:hypothetical protein
MLYSQLRAMLRRRALIGHVLFALKAMEPQNQEDGWFDAP